MRLPFNGNFPVTQVFGVNPQDYVQFGMAGHNGQDYGLPSGTPVVAALDGIVTVMSDPPGFGTYVQIVSAQYKTIYAHLDHATVASGAMVTAGQQIGVSDNTGNSSGPHLHFGVKPINANVNNGFFGAIDPQPILDQDEQTNTGELTMTPEVKAVLDDLKSHILLLEKAVFGSVAANADIPLTARVEDVKQQVIDRANDLAKEIKE